MKRPRLQRWRRLWGAEEDAVNQVDVERFHAHVLKGPTPDACWLWLGAISDDGYGRLWFNTPSGQKVVSAHRFALAAVHGGLKAIEDQTARHRCDVPLCVRASLKQHGWDQGFIRQLVHDVDPHHPTLF